jgi:hypothetical protein
MSSEGRLSRRGGRVPAGMSLAMAAAALCLFAQCRLFSEQDTATENYVTVRLNDSLSRYDSVVVLILAGGDSSAIVGTLWSRRLDAPGAIPTYRLDAGETRDMTVWVRAWDADGRLVLDESIAKVDGKQIVTIRPIPKPSPRLASLSVSPGTLSPGFAPGTHAYSVSLPASQTSVQIKAAPEYGPARLFVGALQTAAGELSAPVGLAVGSNRITLTVFAADTIDQYVLTVQRAAAPIDTTKPVPVDTTNPVPVDTTKPVPVDTTKPVPVDTTKPVPVDTTKPVPVDTTKPVPVDTTKPVPVDTVMQDWKHKGMVVLTLPSAAGLSLNGPARATGFPLLLRLNSANFDFSEAADSGRDLRFRSLNGSALDYAIARWDASAKQAEVYIRCDTLSAVGQSPSILMYWGNAKAAAGSASGKVFSKDAGWSGVWHLEEKGTGKSGEYQDATGMFPGTGGGAYPTRYDGPVGNSQDFNSGSQGWIQLPKEYEPGQDGFTMNMWIYYEGRDVAYVFIKSDYDVAAQRFLLNISQGSGTYGVGSNGATSYLAYSAQNSAWQQLGIVCKADSLRFYANGVLKDSRPFALKGNSLGNGIIGARNPNGDQGFLGRLDEIWSYSGARDAWYMRLLYENQKPGSTLATLSRL